MKATHLLGLALLLTACSSSAQHSSSTGVPSPAGSSPSDTSPPTVQVTHPPASPPGVSRCVASALRASLGRSLGSAGQMHVALLLTNASGVTCVLAGFPGLSFTAAVDGRQLGSPARRDLRYPAVRVALRPRATAHATATITDYGVYDPTRCVPATATGFRLFPPGSTRSLLITAPQTACSRPGVQGFEVTVVRSGVSPS